MSIQRSRSSDASEAAKPREPDSHLRPQDKREPPNLEKVDQFRALMQAKENPQKKTIGDLVREFARKADAQVAVRDGDASAARSEATSELLKDQAVARAEHRQHSDSSDALPPAEAAMLWQAQMALRDAPTPAAAPPSQVNTAAFAELIERHVRQFAIGSSGPDGDGQVLLRLADSTLPGTDLLLSRTADGWLLRADVRSRSSFDAIQQAAPELARRFAERDLGMLSIDPHFHG